MYGKKAQHEFTVKGLVNDAAACVKQAESQFKLLHGHQCVVICSRHCFNDFRLRSAKYIL